ncbi:MAG TPA: hypothetical protein VHY08_16725, partial [Bacillota bacterium]|nr:hypothetical protein [Bacillota bacterium]
MKMKTINWLLPIIGLCVLVGAVIFLSSPWAQSINNKAWNRSDYLKKTAEIAKKYQKNTTNNRIRLEYARKCFEVGEFLKSQDLLQPLLNGPNPSADAKYLSAHIEYLYG